MYLPLHPKLHDLLEEYLYNTSCDGSDYLIPSPKFDNQLVSGMEIRKQLKKNGLISNIKKRVIPQVIRHCTATHLTLLAVEHQYITALLGHIDSRSTALY